MNTRRNQLIRRATATAAALGAVALGPLAGSASASDTYRSGSSVGVHTDASAFCQNSPERKLTATPMMGTTPGWETSQTVAWRYNVYNVSTGKFVVSESTWRTRQIATLHYTQNYYGNWVAQIDQYASLPATAWNLGPGKYVVAVEYAWWTGTSWSTATSVSTNYTNSYVFLGLWRYYTAGTCDVDVVANR